LKNIDENIKNNRKVILYLNKRWEYSSLICKKCNHLHKCKNCDISMSLHWDNMICHSCWYSKKIVSNCENCKSKELQKVWVGTKQIEDVIKNIYKDKIVYRLDTDIVKNKKTKQEALDNIEKADIVIGTKMITTGFNFLNVWLIWVILLEQELQIASYNTEEKVFSNIKQLIWRGWRLWQKTDFKHLYLKTL
jgi:primosomal protein N' (replication factor Y)